MATADGQPTIDDALSTIARERPVMTRGSATLREVAVTLIEHNCSAAVVAGRDGSHHVVTERDIVRGLASGKDPDDEWAVDVMSADLRTLPADQPIRDAAQLMLDAVIRHVIISKPGEPAMAMVSIRDLLAPFLASTEH